MSDSEDEELNRILNNERVVLSAPIAPPCVVFPDDDDDSNDAVVVKSVIGEGGSTADRASAASRPSLDCTSNRPDRHGVAIVSAQEEK